MAFPLAAIGTGLNLAGGIYGLLSSGAAAKRARAAMEQAINDQENAYNADLSATLGSGRRGLYDLTGNLNDALATTGRSLGAAQAAGGVYNSSAVSGALANQGAANTQAISKYAGGLTDTLARIRAQGLERTGQMRYGLAQNDMNYARELQAGGAQGIASVLGSLGQLNLTNQGVVGPNRTGPAINGTSNGSVLDVNVPRFIPQGYQPYQGVGFKRRFGAAWDTGGQLPYTDTP